MKTAKDMRELMKVKTNEEMNRIYARKSGWRFKPAAEPVGKPVFARVDFDRLIADCECHGAEYVDPDDLRFYCHSCGNAANGGNYRPVILPDEVK